MLPGWDSSRESDCALVERFHARECMHPLPGSSARTRSVWVPGGSLVAHQPPNGEASTATSWLLRKLAVEVRQRLACEGAKMLLCLLPRLEAGELQGIPQEPTLTSCAPKIREADACILWHESAQQVHNRIRAMNPNPGAVSYTHLRAHE